jgi:hypothetical protein
VGIELPDRNPVHAVAASRAVVLDVLGGDGDASLLTRDVARRVYRL